MGLFDTDYSGLVPQLLPVRLRQQVMKAWLAALVSPIKFLYNAFYANRANNLYELAHNGQVCYLEAVLNDAFDNTLRRITIGPGNSVQPVYLGRRSELTPVYLGRRTENLPVYLPRRSEVVPRTGGSFTVHVPAGLVYDTSRMMALINKYKLPSKSYTIVSP